MTIEELRDYVEEQRNLNNIPYHVYSTLIDGIDTLEQEPTTTKNDSAKYCDRNICLKNEYNNVGCEDCEVTKSQRNDCAEQNGCITCSLDDGDDCCSKLYEESMQEPTTVNDSGVDAISRAEAQIEMEMNASRYTIAKERGGMGQVEWSDRLIKVSDAVDIIRNLPSVTPQNQVYPLCEDCHTKMDEVRRAYDNAMKQEPILDKINKMKSEIADSLEFWDYSPNNNPLARDMLETLTNFWGDIKAETENP